MIWFHLRSELRHQWPSWIVVAQAMVFGAVGLVVGLPLGLLVGARAWRGVADGLGFAGDAIVPTSTGAIVPAVIVLMLVIGSLPAVAAARTRPAVPLRAE